MHPYKQTAQIFPSFASPTSLKKMRFNLLVTHANNYIHGANELMGQLLSQVIFCATLKMHQNGVALIIMILISSASIAKILFTCLAYLLVRLDSRIVKNMWGVS